MDRLRRLLVLACVVAAPAAAQGLRDGDAKLTAGALHERLAGMSVRFHDGSEARFSRAGDYTYRYRPQDPAFGGTYLATEDSQVCVTFSGGFRRCDTYVMNGGRLVLITRDGLRFPVKTLTGLD